MCLSSFFYPTKGSFLRDPHLDHPILHADRVCRNIDDRRQLHGFARPDIKFAAVPGTDDVITFHVSISKWTIVVCANVVDREELIGYVEDHNCLSLDLHKQTLAIREFGSGRYLKKFDFGFISCCVIEHGFCIQVFK